MRPDDLFTLREMLRLAPIAPTPDMERAALIGLILPLLDANLDTGEQDFGWHVDRLSTAIALGQAEAYFDGYGRLYGCALWTHADAHAERLLMARGPRALGAALQSRQGAPWLLEMCSLFGAPSPLLDALNEGPLASASDLTYFRLVRGRRLVKQVTREDRMRFARRRTRAQDGETPRFLSTAEGHAMLRETASAIERAVERGHALNLLRTSRHVASMSLGRALQRAGAPLGLGQARLRFSPAGEPLALLTWAWLDGERLPATLARTPESLARHEWNEGELLCVCDAVGAGLGLDWLAGELTGHWMPGQTLYRLPGWHGAQGDCVGPAQRWDAAHRAGLDLAGLRQDWRESDALQGADAAGAAWPLEGAQTAGRSTELAS